MDLQLTPTNFQREYFWRQLRTAMLGWRIAWLEEPTHYIFGQAEILQTPHYRNNTLALRLIPIFSAESQNMGRRPTTAITFTVPLSLVERNLIMDLNEERSTVWV